MKKTSVNNSFNLDHFGAIETHSLLISLKFTTEEFHKIQNIPYEELSNDDKANYITYHHELDHFKLLTTTPTGLLIWRCYQNVWRDLTYLTNYFNIKGIKLNLNGRSIIDWIYQDGYKVLQRKHLFNGNEFFRYDYLNYVIKGLEYTLIFMDILIGQNSAYRYNNWTINDFEILLNNLYPYLADRNGTVNKFLWKSKLNPETKLFGYVSADLNIRDLIEASAINVEEHIVDNDNDEFQNYWKTLRTNHKEPYYKVMRCITDSRLFSRMINLSLSSSIDILSYRPNTNIHFIEDEFPWFRMEKSISNKNIEWLEKSSSESLYQTSRNDIVSDDSLYHNYLTFSEENKMNTDFISSFRTHQKIFSEMQMDLFKTNLNQNLNTILRSELFEFKAPLIYEFSDKYISNINKGSNINLFIHGLIDGFMSIYGYNISSGYYLNSTASKLNKLRGFLESFSIDSETIDAYSISINPKVIVGLLGLHESDLVINTN